MNIWSPSLQGECYNVESISQFKTKRSLIPSMWVFKKIFFWWVVGGGCVLRQPLLLSCTGISQHERASQLQKIAKRFEFHPWALNFDGITGCAFCKFNALKQRVSRILTRIKHLFWTGEVWTRSRCGDAL